MWQRPYVAYKDYHPALYKNIVSTSIYMYDALLSTTCAVVHGCFETSNYSWVPETFRILVHESYKGLAPRLFLFPFELPLSLDQNKRI